MVIDSPRLAVTLDHRDATHAVVADPEAHEHARADAAYQPLKYGFVATLPP
jgi:hypothetical protein